MRWSNRYYGQTKGDEQMHYGEHVRRHARRQPDRVALIDRGREITYSRLNERSDRLVQVLRARGIKHGDRVAVLADNSHPVVETMVACCKGGFVHVPFDFRLAPNDVEALLHDSGARALILGPDYVDAFEKIMGSVDLDVVLVLGPASVVLDGSENFEECLARASGAGVGGADVVGSDMFCILYTSGTTGSAKGVVFTHDQTLANATEVVIHYDIGPDARYIVSYPHNSAGSVNHVFGPVLMRGGTLILDEVKSFNAKRYFSLVERHSATHGQLVPTMVFRLLESRDREEFDLSSLHTVGYASAPIPPQRVEKMLEVFGPIFVHAYGMTETCSIATVLGKEDHRVVGTKSEHRLASCGRPTYGVDLKIVDVDGTEVPRGQVGEIAMRGRWLTTGYFADPERTQEAIRGGWLHSGDLARMDEDDYVYIVDRKKDLIITGGANVASTEVEAAVYAHPHVLEAAVIGVPDEEWGERIHAVVVPTDGVELEPDDVISFCRQRLASFKCPKTVEVREVLPKTSTGKFAKNELRKEYR